MRKPPLGINRRRLRFTGFSQKTFSKLNRGPRHRDEGIQKTIAVLERDEKNRAFRRQRPIALSTFRENNLGQIRFNRFNDTTSTLPRETTTVDPRKKVFFRTFGWITIARLQFRSVRDKT